MDEDKRLDLLQAEYTMLQEFYEDIDHRGLTIKNWSVTVALAGFGAGVLYSHHLFLGVFLAAVLFWYLEGYWRGLSFFFSRRILEIEKAIRKDTWEDLDPLQVYFCWDRSYEKFGDQTRRYMFKQASLWPHVAIGLVSIVLFLLTEFGLIDLLS